MAKRPIQIPARETLSAASIASASYVGSPEHKDRRWWGGLPGAFVDASGKVTRPKRQNTTICHLVSNEDRVAATEWVRAALRHSQLRYYEADQVYPNHIWYKQDNGQVWFGRCVNTVLGQYKGWPIDEDERRAIFG